MIQPSILGNLQTKDLKPMQALSMFLLVSRVVNVPETSLLRQAVNMLIIKKQANPQKYTKWS